MDWRDMSEEELIAAADAAKRAYREERHARVAAWLRERRERLTAGGPELTPEEDEALGEEAVRLVKESRELRASRIGAVPCESCGAPGRWVRCEGVWLARCVKHPPECDHT